MKEKRRYIRFKSDETRVTYFSHDQQQFPALVEDESQNSLACILLGEFDFAQGDHLSWIENASIETTVQVIRFESIDRGVSKLVVRLLDPEVISTGKKSEGASPSVSN